MPKILLIAEFDKFGGTHTYFKLLTRFYKSHNFDVVVALPKSQMPSTSDSFLPDTPFRCVEISERKSGCFSFFWRRFPFDALLDIKSALRLIIKEMPDLVVVSVGSPGLYLGLIALPIRFLYILHTYPHSGEGRLLILQRLKRVLLNFLLCQKKVILTVSNCARTQIAKSWLGDDKSLAIKVVYNTAGPSLSAAQPRIFPSSQKVVILTLGHVNWYKNPFAWIQVAQTVFATLINKEVEFIWAGDGDQLEECRTIITTTGLDSRVKFVGMRENVKELYESSHIYFQPSLIESQGISVIEAMRFSLPCIVSNAGGLPESIVNDFNGYVVNVNDTATMARELVRLVSDQSLREQMGKAGRERYNKLFTDEIWEHEMTAIHNDILK